MHPTENHIAFLLAMKLDAPGTDDVSESLVGFGIT